MLLIFSYILFFALPALAWFYLKQKKQIHIGLVAIITLVLSLALVVCVFFLEEKKEKRALYALNLDSSGSFSDEEMTPEAQAAMERWTNDAGRMFIPIVAVVFSAIWLVVNFTTLYIFTPNQRAEPDGTGQPM